jgi:uncharacterized protein (TIGR00369 family)
MTAPSTSTLETADLREREIAWTDPAALATARRQSAGLDFFARLARGELPAVPMYRTLGFRIAAVEPGSALFEGDTGEFLENSFGVLHGGYAATLLDSACGVGVQSRLPRGRGTATIRLELDFLRPAFAATGRVQCRSHLVQLGRNIARSEAGLAGPDGKVLARARGTFSVFDVPAAAAEAAAPERTSHRRMTRWRDPAPLHRAAETRTGLDYVAAMADGSLPPIPMYATMGCRIGAYAEGAASVHLTPDGSHYNPMGGVHGGLAAFLIDSATGCTVQTVVPQGRGATTVNLAIDYFRPISAETGPLESAGRIVRAGRQIAIADAAIKDAAGRVYARGSATYFIYPMGKAA